MNTQKCDACGGSGVLVSAAYLHDDYDVSFDADHISRCDTCEQYAGDLEAAREVARQQLGGCWLVWATNLEGYLPSTEQSHIFVRSTPGDAACLQLEMLRGMESESDIPNVLVHVEFIERGEPNELLLDRLIELDYSGN